MAKNKNSTHRFYIYEKFNYACNYCKLRFNIPNNWNKKDAIFDNGMFLELDHIIPVSKNGLDTIENKQALCQKCNNLKSNK